MRRIFTVCLLLSFGGFILSLSAQVEVDRDTTKQAGESSFLKNKGTEDGKRVIMLPEDLPEEAINNTSVIVLGDSIIQLREEFKPNPSRAVIYSVIFPGLGQVYNRKYWKLPIIYGGFLGLTYAISWNGRMYNDYSRAYKDIMTGEGESWKDFINNPNISDAEIERLKPVFKRQKDNLRRNRDLAIICTVGLYALCIIDAYVDAQLYDFDVSPDLSMRVSPIMVEPTSYNQRTFGLQCSITF